MPPRGARPHRLPRQQGRRRARTATDATEVQNAVDGVRPVASRPKAEAISYFRTKRSTCQRSKVSPLAVNILADSLSAKGSKSKKRTASSSVKRGTRRRPSAKWTTALADWSAGIAIMVLSAKRLSLTRFWPCCRVHQVAKVRLKHCSVVERWALASHFATASLQEGARAPYPLCTTPPVTIAPRLCHRGDKTRL